MKTKEELNSFIEEVKNLKGKLTEDERKQMVGEESIDFSDKKTPEVLPDQMLESVTGGGGYKDEYESYLTAIYACPKCNGAHAVRIYVGPVAMHPYWSNGCVDFSSKRFDVEFSKAYAGIAGELISEIDSTVRYPIVIVCNTVRGETQWLL